jgi:hypothetical protein
MIYFQYTAEQEGSTWVDTALVLTSALFTFLSSLKILYVFIFYGSKPEVSIEYQSSLSCMHKYAKDLFVQL